MKSFNRKAVHVAVAIDDAEKLKARIEIELNCREIFASKFNPVMD